MCSSEEKKEGVACQSKLKRRGLSDCQANNKAEFFFNILSKLSVRFSFERSFIAELRDVGRPRLLRGKTHHDSRAGVSRRAA